MSKYLDNSQQPSLVQLLLAGRPAITETITRSDATQRGIFMRQAATVAWLQFWNYVFGLVWVLLFPLGIYMLVSHFLIYPVEDWRLWLFVVTLIAIILMLLFAKASWEPRRLLIKRLKSEISQDDVQESLAIVRRMIEQQAAQPKLTDPGPVLVPVTQPAGAKPASTPLHPRVIKARMLYTFVQSSKMRGLARDKRDRGLIHFDDWGKCIAQLAGVKWIAKNGVGYDWMKQPDEILAILHPYCQFANGDTWQPEERDGLD